MDLERVTSVPFTPGLLPVLREFGEPPSRCPVCPQGPRRAKNDRTEDYTVKWDWKLVRHTRRVVTFRVGLKEEEEGGNEEEDTGTGGFRDPFDKKTLQDDSSMSHPSSPRHSGVSLDSGHRLIDVLGGTP